MYIAVTGMNPMLSSVAAVMNPRQASAVDATRANQRTSQSADSSQNSTSQQTSRTGNTAQPARVINGEVLSSETTRLGAQESPVLLRSSANNQQSTNSQPDTRRIAVPQALQNFQQNEEMMNDSSSPRQVSGIIDVFA